MNWGRSHVNSKTLEGTGLFMETGIWDIFKLWWRKRRAYNSIIQL